MGIRLIGVVAGTIAACVVAHPACAQEAPVQQGCALASMRALCDALGRPLAKPEAERLGVEFADARSMESIARMGQSVGLVLEGYRATFAEVIQQARPAILHLEKPQHFLLFLGASAETAQVVDSGQFAVMGRRELEQRFTGHVVYAPTAAKGGPRIAVAEPDCFLALRAPGEEAAHTFGWKNAGAQPLVLEVDSKSCSCTVVQADAGPTPPGGSGSLTLRAKPGSGEGFTAVMLKTNDPDRPRVPLTLRTRVPWGITVFPDAARLVASPRQPARAALRVTADPGIRIQGSRQTRGEVRLAVEIREERAPRADQCAWVITVTSPTDLAAGSFEDVLTLETSDAARPAVAVPVHLRVEGDLVITPPEAFFGLLKACREGATTRVTIRSSSEKTFQPRVVGTSARSIQASIKPARRSPRARLTLPLIAHVLTVKVDTSAPGPISGFVDLRTSVPGQEQIRVPVSGLVE